VEELSDSTADESVIVMPDTPDDDELEPVMYCQVS
jgi:hypothetical protein